jgi:hypothetical protein
LAAWVFRQFRKPSGWLGRRVVRAMNLSHTMADRDALLLARPARQRPRDLEGTQTRWEFRPNCRNVPRRAFPATLRHSNAAAPRRIPQRRRAPGPPDPGRIHRGRDHAPVREKLDLRHGPQAAIAGPVPGPEGTGGKCEPRFWAISGLLGNNLYPFVGNSTAVSRASLLAPTTTIG